MLEIDEFDVISFEDAKAEYEYQLEEYRNGMKDEDPKMWRFIFNRNRDAETLAYLTIDEDCRGAIVN